MAFIAGNKVSRKDKNRSDSFKEEGSFDKINTQEDSPSFHRMTGRNYAAGQIKGEADPGVISEDEDEFAVIHTHARKIYILNGCPNFSLTSCRTRVQLVLWARAMPCQIHTPTPPPFLWAIPWKTSPGVSFWGAPLEHRQLNLLETLQKKKRRRKPPTNGRKRFSAEERKVNFKPNFCTELDI